jgi:adenylylsulfate kinase
MSDRRSKITNENTTWHEPTVYRDNRESLNKHRSVTIWFTGLSGSGKSTLAHAVEDYLHKGGVRTFVLDGDNIRQGLCKDLGFTDEDRTENIRRIGEVSKLLVDAGVLTIAAFISPFRKDRNLVRELNNEDDFIEIYCKASVEECENRDTKGLYKKARAGDVPEFTGISSPYEEPENPELIIDTVNSNIEICVEKVVNYLEERGIISITSMKFGF